MQIDAEDLARDAWLRLYGRGETARDRGAFFITIRDLSVDRYRRSCRLATAMVTVRCGPARTNVRLGSERASGDCVGRPVLRGVPRRFFLINKYLKYNSARR